MRAVTVAASLTLSLAGCGGRDRDRTGPDASVAPGSAGTPDDGFGTGGLVVSELAGRDLGRAITGQVVGGAESLLVGGKAGASGQTSFVLMRYGAGGERDPSFGAPTASPPGVVAVKFDPRSFDEGKSLAVQPDGAIVFAGITTIGDDGSFGVARLDASGHPDDSFDGDGMAVATFGPGNDEGKSVGLQRCGNPPSTCIVVAGKAEAADGFGDIAWARFDASGAVERQVTTDLRGPNDEANDIVVLADGRFVLVGESGNGTASAIAAIRYTAAGQLDTTFGDGDGAGARKGYVISRVGGDDHAYAAAVDASGRIVAVGRTPGTGGDDMLVVRYTPDGMLDRTFDGDGHREIRIDGTDDIATGVMIDGAGRIAVAGRSTASGSRFLLVRLRDDGRDDTDFGDAGHAVLTPAVPMSSDSDDGAYGATAQADGKLVLIGELRGDDDDLAIVRVLP